MKYLVNKEIQAFFNRCHDNLTHDQKNSFLGMPITVENEKNIQHQMHKAQFGEFLKPKNSWPSLFISSDAFSQRAFATQVNLSRITHQDFTYTKEVLPANELFNVDSIIFDENRELNDWMVLRALDKPYESICLWQKDKLWMLDSPSEANTIDPYALKARGNVCTFGLGIGYFIFMANLNPNVTSITVIEKQQEVVDLFKQDIYPQLRLTKPLEILVGDGLDYYHQDFLDKFDYVFVDMWQSSDDGLLMIESCLQQANIDFEKVDFWIESSCLEIMPALIFLVLSSYATNQKIVVDKKYSRLVKKIEKTLMKLQPNCLVVDDYKDMMYDRKLFRDILATSL